MKNKKRLIGILFAAVIALLPAFPTGAQAANVDSLEQVLRTGKLSNGERLQLYYDLSMESRNTDAKKASSYIQEGLANNGHIEIRSEEGKGTEISMEFKIL